MLIIVSGIGGAIKTTIIVGGLVWIVSLAAGTAVAWGTILPLIAAAGFCLGAFQAFVASLV